MIKINVITNNETWLNYIRKPNYYLDKKINKLSIKKKNLKRIKFFAHYYFQALKKLGI